MITNRDQERRKFTWLTIYFSIAEQRREIARREIDIANGHYCDKISKSTFFIASWLVLVCALDAILTLIILNNGGVELNPIMLYFLNISTAWFLAIKSITTVSCLLFLVIHEHFSLLKLIRGRSILLALCIGYTTLVTYEIMIILTN